MSKKDMTLVYYYIPEDKDDPDCPNVFGVAQSKANIRLSHIHQSFPLKGSYLYRFKHNHEGTAVWLDLPDKESKLPTYKDRIIIKATRVQWNDSKLHSQYKEKQAAHSQPVKRVEDINVFEESNHSQPVKQLQTKQQQQNFNHHNLFDPKPVLIQPAHKPDNNEFNLFEHGSHNGANLVVNHGGNQKSQPMHFLQEFKHGDLI